MMKFLKKMTLIALLAATALAVLPLTNVYAAGSYDPPPSQDGQISSERLELIWARQLNAYERFGRLFNARNPAPERVQTLIDRAAENGRDVSAVQAALDAFESAIKDARPAYEGIKDTVNLHSGFDANGRVIDSEKAKGTIREMHGSLTEIRTMLGDASRNLREAIQAFREANKPAGNSSNGR